MDPWVGVGSKLRKDAGKKIEGKGMPRDPSQKKSRQVTPLHKSELTKACDTSAFWDPSSQSIAINQSFIHSGTASGAIIKQRRRSRWAHPSLGNISWLVKVIEAAKHIIPFSANRHYLEKSWREISQGQYGLEAEEVHHQE